MLKGIKQTDSGLLPTIRKYGCLFLCFAHASPFVFEGADGIMLLNSIWRIALETGIISGDLNGDGDMDDALEAEVQNHVELALLLGMRIRYDGKKHSPDEVIPVSVKFAIGCFEWKGIHFVNIDRSKRVTHDPYGESNTVKNGCLKNTRWYYAD